MLKIDENTVSHLITEFKNYNGEKVEIPPILLEKYKNKQINTVDLEKILGRSRQYWQEFIKRNGIKSYTPYNKLPIKEIIEDFKIETINDIARKYNTFDRAIRTLLKENGIETNISKSKKIDRKKLIEMYYTGYKYSRIAAEFKASTTLIIKILKEEKVEKRSTIRPSNKKIKRKPNFNKQSIFFFHYFDKLNNTHGFYGENEFWIEKLDYYLDYINFDLKIIIEWDEKQHKYKKEIDEIRQKEIQELFPDFTFKRIEE